MDHRGEFDEFKSGRARVDGYPLGGFIVGDIRDSLKLGGDRPGVNIVVSLGTLYFVPEVLEIIEDVYNNRLSMGGVGLLEIGPPNLVEIVTPSGKIRPLEAFVDHLQSSEDYGMRAKNVPYEGEPAMVFEMRKKKEAVEFPLYLYDLPPNRNVRRPTPSAVIRQYKSTEEF